MDQAPKMLQYVARDNRMLQEKIVRTIARSKPRDIFGELTTEHFCVAEQREKQSQRAKEVLQQILGPMGIVVEKVLTKGYRFNKECQKAIEDKKVADQQVQKKPIGTARRIRGVQTQIRRGQGRSQQDDRRH